MADLAMLDREGVDRRQLGAGHRPVLGGRGPGDRGERLDEIGNVGDRALRALPGAVGPLELELEAAAAADGDAGYRKHVVRHLAILRRSAVIIGGKPGEDSLRPCWQCAGYRAVATCPALRGGIA